MPGIPEFMNYYIVPNSSSIEISGHALALIFDLTRQSFTGILRISRFEKTPIILRRALPIDEISKPDFVHKSDITKPRQIRREDFNILAKALVARNRPPEQKIVFLQSAKIIITTLKPHQSQAKSISIDKNFYATNLLRQTALSLGRKNEPLRQPPEVKSLFRHDNIRFVSDNFERFAFAKNHARKNFHCVFAGNKTAGLPSQVRNVAVFTSVAGTHLSHLGENLEFWSRGVKGFYWKHFYGKPDARRIEKALRDTKADVVIFRGHGHLKNGKIFWEIDKQWYSPEFRRNCIYVHLSCLEKSDQKKLSVLPAGLNILPNEYYPDHDNIVALTNFFTHVQNGAMLIKAAEQLCLEDDFLLPVFQ